jgi:hypothetical protein
VFETIRRRIRRHGSLPAAQTSPSDAKTPDAPAPDAPAGGTAEPSTDAEDFHIPPAEVFQEEEQDGQGSSPRLHGE